MEKTEDEKLCDSMDSGREQKSGRGGQEDDANAIYSRVEEGNNCNSLEDIQWLASLSEPELDLLLSLKQLAIKRAQRAGCKRLAEKFNLRVLCNFGALLLDYFKEQVCNTPLYQNSDEALALLRRSRLATFNKENVVQSKSSKEIEALTSKTSRLKRMWDEFGCEEGPKPKKQKTKEK